MSSTRKLQQPVENTHIKDEVPLVKPIPWLDYLLAILFVSECVYTVYFLWTRPDSDGQQRLFEVIIGIAFVMCVIFQVKRVAGHVFMAIRNRYDRAKKQPIEIKRKSKNKFKEQAWQLVVHVTMSGYSLYVMRPDVDDGASWWEETLNCWIGPGGKLNEPANSPLDRVYVIQMAIWIATAISHVCFDEKHKDYYVMYMHHIVTIFLVCFSWGINVKFGFLVLFVHDVSDIGIDLLKLCFYCDYGMDELGLPVTEVVFITALISWVYFRLFQFPVKLIRAAWFESGGGTLPDGTPYDGVCYDRWDDCWTLRIALVVLLVMHIYWTYLLVSILVEGLSKSAGREHYEGRSDTDEELDKDVKSENKKQK